MVTDGGPGPTPILFRLRLLLDAARVGAARIARPAAVAVCVGAALAAAWTFLPAMLSRMRAEMPLSYWLVYLSIIFFPFVAAIIWDAAAVRFGGPPPPLRPWTEDDARRAQQEAYARDSDRQAAAQRAQDEENAQREASVESDDPSTYG